MIGRKREQQILDTCLQPTRPEFLAVYVSNQYAGSVQSTISGDELFV